MARECSYARTSAFSRSDFLVLSSCGDSGTLGALCNLLKLENDTLSRSSTLKIRSINIRDDGFLFLMILLFAKQFQLFLVLQTTAIES